MKDRKVPVQCLVKKSHKKKDERKSSLLRCFDCLWQHKKLEWSSVILFHCWRTLKSHQIPPHIWGWTKTLWKTCHGPLRPCNENTEESLHMTFVNWNNQSRSPAFNIIIATWKLHKRFEWSDIEHLRSRSWWWIYRPLMLDRFYYNSHLSYL